MSNPFPTQAEPAQQSLPKRPAYYLWAVLIARIYEVIPLLGRQRSGQRIGRLHRAVELLGVSALSLPG